jgi:cbb3-type cytochrome oxidase maturation protein
MAVIYVLLGISLLMAGIFLLVFIWSLSSGQYEDDYTPSMRILLDEKPKKSDLLN